MDSCSHVPRLGEKTERHSHIVIRAITGRCYVEATDKGLGKPSHLSLKSCVHLYFPHLCLTFLKPCWDTQDLGPLATQLSLPSPPDPLPTPQPGSTFPHLTTAPAGTQSQEQREDCLGTSPGHTKVSQDPGWEMGLQESNTAKTLKNPNKLVDI